MRRARPVTLQKRSKRSPTFCRFKNSRTCLAGAEKGCRQKHTLVHGKQACIRHSFSDRAKSVVEKKKTTLLCVTVQRKQVTHGNDSGRGLKTGNAGRKKSTKVKGEGGDETGEGRPEKDERAEE